MEACRIVLNRQRKGARVPEMTMASRPSIAQDNEAMPGCVGIGKRVRWGGRACPDKIRPSGGRPKSTRRRMPMGIILEEDTAIKLPWRHV